jgi:hypothetical protein
MTALAADKKVKFQDGEFASFLVKAAQQIYLGAMVTVYPSTGYAYAGVNTSTHRFAGIAEENVLGVTDGVERVKVRCRGIAKLVGSGLAITDVGKEAWLADDNTIQTTPTNVLVGMIVGVPSATEALVDLRGGPLPATAMGATTITGNCTVSGTVQAEQLTTTDDATITDDLAVGGDLAVTGAITGASLTVTGTVQAEQLTTTDDLTVAGLATIGETLGVTGIATFTGRPIIPTVLFASLGSAAATGQICYCATGHGGSPGILVANGTNWIAPDGATAAET